IEKGEAFVYVNDASIFIDSIRIISYHAQLKIPVGSEFPKSIASLQVIVEVCFRGSVVVIAISDITVAGVLRPDDFTIVITNVLVIIPAKSQLQIIQIRLERVGGSNQIIV